MPKPTSVAWQEVLRKAWQKVTEALPGDFEARLLEFSDRIDRVVGRTRKWEIDYDDVRLWLAEETAQQEGLTRAIGELVVGVTMVREGHHWEGAAYLEDLAERWTDPDSRWVVLRSFAFVAAGWGAYQVDEYDRAMALCTQALHAARKAGSVLLEARALHHRGVVHGRLYEWDQARAEIERARQIYEEKGYESGLTRVEDSLGRVDFERGDFASAETWFSQGLQRAQGTHNRRAQARLHGDLARLYLEREEFSLALQNFREARRLSEEMGDRYAVMRLDNFLGETHLLQGNLEAAQEHFERSLALAEQEGHARGEAYARYHLGRAAVRRGELGLAHEYMETARTHFVAQGMKVEVALLDALDASIHAARGEGKEAEASYERSLEALRALNIPRLLGEVLIDYGFWLRERGQGDRALPLILEALQTSARMQAERLVQRLRATISSVGVEEWTAALLRLKEQGDELARRHAEIRRLEDLRQELTGMIVHDLKNPLTGILTSLQTIQALGDGEPALRRELLEMAISNTRSLFNMIQDILDVDRLESGKLPLTREEVQLGDVVEVAVNQLRSYAERAESTIQVKGLENLPSLRIDRELIRRVLVNLLGNAIRYAAPGPITISAQAIENAQAVIVSVQDQGPGIPPADLERIFDKYARVSQEDRPRSKQGTGLGLAFCKLAVEAHGGRIWVESVLGQGSTFSFRLPVG